jgi:hypothetical protein
MGHGHDTGLPPAFHQFCQLFVPIEKRPLALLRAAILPALLYSYSPIAVEGVSVHQTTLHTRAALPYSFHPIPSSSHFSSCHADVRRFRIGNV